MRNAWLVGFCFLLIACGNGGGQPDADKPVATVVCIGDSLTYGFGLNREDAYPQQLEVLLNTTRPERRWAVINAGISGDTTRGMLARFATDVVTKSPQFVVILGGTNDLGYGYDLSSLNASYTLDAPGGMKDNVLAMIAAARANGVMPIVATVLPNGGIEAPQYDIERAAMVSWLSWERALSGVPVADFYALFEDPARQWYPIPAYTRDNLHPSAIGAGVMAAAVAAVL
jgi:acyl-CoA thioesterase-1